MARNAKDAPAYVHCRTGSLEMFIDGVYQTDSVHCRTGSLEKIAGAALSAADVHCRTGSLETIRRTSLNLDTCTAVQAA